LDWAVDCTLRCKLPCPLPERSAQLLTSNISETFDRDMQEATTYQHDESRPNLKMNLKLNLSLTFLILFITLPARPQESIEGHWKGALVRGGAVQIVLVDFIKDTEAINVKNAEAPKVKDTEAPKVKEAEAPRVKDSERSSSRSSKRSRQGSKYPTW
jgi:hypothetical protein